MGRLVDQPIRSLFRGVSRQPPAVRLAGQMEDAENTVFSVTLGGFTKRPPTQHIKTLNIDPGNGKGLTGYRRDNFEEYLFVYGDNTVRAFDTLGDEKTIADVDSASDYYAGASRGDLRFRTFGDFTFVVNRNNTVVESSDTATTGTRAGVVFVRKSDDGSFRVFVDGVERATFVANFNNHDADDIAADLRSDLTSNLGAGWTVELAGTHVIVQKDDGTDFEMYGEAPNEDDMVVVRDWAPSVDDLPARALNDMVVRVGADLDSAEFHMKFVEIDDGSRRGSWEETVSPETSVGFDPDRMPHALVRQANGTFKFQRVDWNTREVGSLDTVPNPEFVGRKINDLLFHKERMALLAGETIYYSASGDYFNFFPEKSTQKTEADPFGLNASGEDVATLRFGVSHSALMFAVGPESQWQIHSQGQFEAKQADIDKATNYPSSTECPPVIHGSELYFVSDDGERTAVFEYFLDEDTVVNTSVDVTSHVLGYLTGPFIDVANHPLSGMIFFVSSGDQDSIYVYQPYWAEDKKIQSAWSKWTFDDAIVHGVQVIGPSLYLLLQRSGRLHVEKVNLDFEILEDDFPFRLRIDRIHSAIGSYDAVTDTTTWELPYLHENSAVMVTGNDWPEELRGYYSQSLTSVTSSSVSLAGDWSQAACLFGTNYTSETELATIYVREGQEDRANTSAKVNLKRLYFDYDNTGYFQVQVSNQNTGVKRSKSFDWLFDKGTSFSTNPSDIERKGTISVRAKGRSTDLSIKVINSSPYPHTIVAARWDGRVIIDSRQDG